LLSAISAEAESIASRSIFPVIIFEAMGKVFRGGAVSVKSEKAAAHSVQDFSSVVGEFDEVINFTFCT
jgi:hypothetical protein